jgi:adenosine deaminase
MPFQMFIDGVGLDSGEDGNPPAKFERAFRRAEELGFRRCAHAGEEGPAGNVTDALELLKAERIDHGVNAIDNPELVSHLADARIPLTMCPLSNQRLQVTPDLSKHPLKQFMDAGVLVTVNSDDPAYFGGYVADNYVAIAEALNLTHEEIAQLAENSLLASWR